MKKRRPLTNEEGEVRELLLEDLKHFKPIARALPPSSLEKLGLRPRPTDLSLILSPASHDPPWQSPEYQRELGEFTDDLRREGLKVSPRVRVHDAVGGGMWLLGTFVIVVGPTIAPAIARLVSKWLQARIGRKVTIKFDKNGVKEVSAQTPEEIGEVLKQIAEFIDRNRRSGGDA